jgi:ADP-heptose:LPS heptosyltransferase
MFVGAGHASRCWPLGKFAELARQLVADERVRCFVFLGPEEAGLRAEIETLFPPSAIILDKLGLLELFAIYGFLDVIVGNDTGPMHLAAASKAHLVLISDESAPDEFLPLTENLTIVRSGRIDKIEVDAVIKAVREPLENDILGVK